METQPQGLFLWTESSRKTLEQLGSINKRCFMLLMTPGNLAKSLLASGRADATEVDALEISGSEDVNITSMILMRMNASHPPRLIAHPVSCRARPGALEELNVHDLSLLACGSSMWRGRKRATRLAGTLSERDLVTTL